MLVGPPDLSLRGGPYNVATPQIKCIVTDCSTISPIVVNSPSATYNSTGTFSCANNGTLFYSNGTQPTSTQTICLVTATWSGRDSLQCWKGWCIARKKIKIV